METLQRAYAKALAEAPDAALLQESQARWLEFTTYCRLVDNPCHKYRQDLAGQADGKPEPGLYDPFHKTELLRAEWNYGHLAKEYEDRAADLAKGKYGFEQSPPGGARRGWIRTHYDNSRLRDECLYEPDSNYGSGYRQSDYRKYYANGQLAESACREGSYSSWYPDGNIRSRGGYSDWQALDGSFIYYHNNGRPWAIVTYDGYSTGGGPDTAGPYAVWYESGRLASAGPSLFSEFVSYYEDGGLMEKMEPTGARRGEYRSYYPGGQLKSAGQCRTLDFVYLNDGEYKEYHENGVLKMRGVYKDGKPQGDLVFFDAAGNQTEVIAFSEEDWEFGICGSARESGQWPDRYPRLED